jgi:hypothetical protein
MKKKQRQLPSTLTFLIYMSAWMLLPTMIWVYLKQYTPNADPWGVAYLSAIIAAAIAYYGLKEKYFRGI